MTPQPLLLALHSCSEQFGVALWDPEHDPVAPLVAVHADGRGLSNSLIARVSEVLPPDRWSALAGLAVATGPGGFTGTRLSVVMARTLAQQLCCSLLGVSSFALMAHRLHPRLPLESQSHPFWITQELPRRGLVGGLYRVNASVVQELQEPALLPEAVDPHPAVTADVDVGADVAHLLNLLKQAHHSKACLPWMPVLPIYPTSPVGPV